MRRGREGSAEPLGADSSIRVALGGIATRLAAVARLRVCGLERGLGGLGNADAAGVMGRARRGLRRAWRREIGAETRVNDVSGRRRTSATLSALVFAPGVVPYAIGPGVTPAAFSLLFPQIEP